MITSVIVLNFPLFTRASICCLSVWVRRIPILVFILTPFSSTALNRAFDIYIRVVTCKMSYSDEIMGILSEEHSLSASKLYEKLKEKGFQKTLRTLQRYLAEMVREGLIESKAIGREIVYSLSNSKGKTPPNHFLVKYWNEIFEIERKLATDSSKEIQEAHAKLRVLAVLLPKEIKKEILPLIKDVYKRFGNKHSLEYVEILECREELISVLDKLADLLHSYEKEGVKP